MRVRVRLDRAANSWRVDLDSSDAVDQRALLASGVQEVRGGRYRTWADAMAAAGRLAGRAELREAEWLASWIRARESAAAAGVAPEVAA